MTNYRKCYKPKTSARMPVASYRLWQSQNKPTGRVDYTRFYKGGHTEEKSR